MDIKKAFADPQLEKAGVWVDYKDGSRVKLARIGNSEFTRLLAQKKKPFRKMERAGNLDEETETKIYCEVIAEAVLLDWEGFNDGGKELKYSKKSAFDMLKTFMDFRSDIVELASSQEFFHKELSADSEKN